MDISVIVPVFNTPTESLLRCFESIKFPKDILWEVIVVDDGSENTTAEFCSVYAKEHEGFRYFRQDNKGVSAARNAGISLAEGRYITFLDSDDELIGEVLEKRVINSDYDLVCFDHILNENGRIRQWKIIDTHEHIVEDKRALLEAAYKNRMNSACTKLFSRKLIQEANLRFDESMVIAEDAVFVLRTLFAAKRPIYITKAAYCYYHSYDNGNSRLLKYPQRAVSNLVSLYDERRKVCGLCLDDKVYMQMIVSASELFIEDLFNSLGTIFHSSDDMIPDEIFSESLAFSIRYINHFALKTRIKCLVLEKNMKLFLKVIAKIREIYVSLM